MFLKNSLLNYINRQNAETRYFGALTLTMITVNLIIFFGWNAPALAIEPKYQEYKITFSDPLYEDWTDQYSQYGSTALFDLNQTFGVIYDICGATNGNTYGRAYDQHKGWDRNIPNDKGKYTVFAIAPGVVELAKDGCIEGDKWCNDGAGNYVKIRHNAKVVSKAFHLATGKVFVKEGQWVDRFTPLGYGGNTGYSFGDHVHVQTEVDGIPVDPLSLAEDWMPAITTNKKKCTQDPQHNLITYQSLREYVLAQLADLDTKLALQGYTIAENDDLHWILDSGGGDKKDILIQIYTKSAANGNTGNTGSNFATDKITILFDLNGHAPMPIVLDYPVFKWWDGSKSVAQSGPGKPIGMMITPETATDQIFFENKVIIYKSKSGSIEEQPYLENASPGMFENGWQAGRSYAIMAAYKKNGGPKKLGYPSGKDSKTPFVHAWTGTDYLLQDFGGGSIGTCGIMLQHSDDNFKACVIQEEMWNIYRAGGNGPQKFGYPLTDQYYDINFEQYRQDFEKGLTILASGDIIATKGTCPGIDSTSTGTTCKCPGNTKIAPCGNCGSQKWICQKSLWVKSGTCENGGVCEPGKIHAQECGQCKGTETRTCTNQCQWSVWSSCSKEPMKEICNYLDDDCDGQTDENTKNACGGCIPLPGKSGESCGPCGIYACETENTLTCKSTAICKKGQAKKEPCVCSGDVRALECDGCIWKEVAPCKVQPKTEVCDSLDNDCDSKTDEDNVCCSQNKEVCNGKDDDCDGQTDENTKNACGGCVQFKVQVNADCGPCAVWKCDGKDNVACTNKPDCCIPSAEFCNGKDDDCDGQTDENTKNPCGGCVQLKFQPLEGCGSCGVWQCDGKDNIACINKPGCGGSSEPPPPSPAPPSPPTPPSPPPPTPPPPPIKNTCGGDSTLSNQPGTSCGNCGTWQCSGQNGVTCTTSGVCTPGSIASMSCQITQPGSLCPSKGGTQTNTCSQQCQWQYGTCTSAINSSTSATYVFETQKVCGGKYCFQITSASETTGYGKMTKPSGSAFGNGPIEWFVRNFTTNKSIGQVVGNGCDNYYTGKYAGDITFKLSKLISGKNVIGLKTHSNAGCTELDITPGITIEKCTP